MGNEERRAGEKGRKIYNRLAVEFSTRIFPTGNIEAYC
jgi:hypothetical protein